VCVPIPVLSVIVTLLSQDTEECKNYVKVTKDVFLGIFWIVQYILYFSLVFLYSVNVQYFLDGDKNCNYGRKSFYKI
jgi:hypothetical protein